MVILLAQEQQLYLQIHKKIGITWSSYHQFSFTLNDLRALPSLAANKSCNKPLHS